MKKFEKKIFSQNGEDGITLELIRLIPHINRTFFEFGVEDGTECNTRILRDSWRGVILDGGYSDPDISLHKEIVRVSNMFDILKKYNIPEDLGILSIDTDYNDAYLAHQLLKKITPTIIIAEYNNSLGLEDKTVVHDPLQFWDRSYYYGCSALCLTKVYHNYVPVYMNDVNIFFVLKGSMPSDFKQQTLEQLISPYLGKRVARLKMDYYDRDYVSSDNVTDRFIQKTTKYAKEIQIKINNTNTNRALRLRQSRDFKAYENAVSNIVDNIVKDYTQDIPAIRTLVCNAIHRKKLKTGGAEKMLVLIISKQYKSGLGKDADIIEHRIPSHFEVLRLTKKAKIDRPIYMKIFLEHIIPDMLQIQSTHTVYIPNIEMLTDWDVKLMKQTMVLCKNMYTFNNIKTPSKKLIKFTTNTYNIKVPKNKNIAIHFGGTSFMKGTWNLVKAWIEAGCFIDINPDIKLIVTTSQPSIYWQLLDTKIENTLVGRDIENTVYKNVHVVSYLGNDDYTYFSNIAQFRIQPSCIEGFGHTVNEGRAYGSVTITTNHPPMNELITDTRCLIDIVETRPTHLLFKRFTNRSAYANRGTAKYAIFDPRSFAIKFASLLRSAELNKIAIEQHASYIKDTEFFEEAWSKLFTRTRTAGVEDGKRSLHKPRILNINVENNYQVPGFEMITDIQPAFIGIVNINKPIPILPCAYTIGVAEPAEPAEPADPAEPAEPADPAETAEPADPAETAEPASCTKPVEPASCTESVNCVEPASCEKPKSCVGYEKPESCVSCVGSGCVHFTISDDGKRDPNNYDLNDKTPFNTEDLSSLCKGLSEGEATTLSPNIRSYEVGEHLFSKRKRKYPNYDDAYKFWVHTNDTVLKDVVAKGYLYEKYAIACMSAYSKKNGIALDVGANIGVVSIPLSKVYKQVISFEPFPATYALLLKNINENKVNNIIPMNCAMGDTPRDTITLSDTVFKIDYRDKKDKGTTVRVDSTAEDVHYGNISIGEGSVTACMISIDSLNLSNVSLLKVDVEGAEPLVFMGAQETIRRCRPVILFEHNDNKISSKTLSKMGATDRFDIVQFCLSLGYKDMYEIPVDNYMLVHPSSKYTSNAITKFRKISSFNRFTRSEVRGYRLHKFMIPKW